MWEGYLEESLEHVDDIHCYSSCDSMEDTAHYYVVKTGHIGEVTSNLQNYIDYETLGRGSKSRSTTLSPHTVSLSI